jgi:hypothetical protein
MRQLKRNFNSKRPDTAGKGDEGSCGSPPNNIRLQILNCLLITPKLLFVQEKLERKEPVSDWSWDNRFYYSRIGGRKS